MKAACLFSLPCYGPFRITCDVCPQDGRKGNNLMSPGTNLVIFPFYTGNIP